MSSGDREITVASMDTHRLIVAVGADGVTEVQSDLHPLEAAYVLRQLVDRYEAMAGKDTPAGGESTRADDVPDEEEEFPSGGDLIRHPSHAPTRRYLAANPLPEQKGGAE